MLQDRVANTLNASINAVCETDLNQRCPKELAKDLFSTNTALRKCRLNVFEKVSYRTTANWILSYTLFGITLVTLLCRTKSSGP